MRPTTEEIEQQLGEAQGHYENGSQWPGMSFEEGVEQALQWVLGQGDPPMDG